MYTFLATTSLALIGVTSAAPTSKTGFAQAVTEKFRLHAFGKGIDRWAIVNAHAAAGQNVLQIQRPTAYVSDKSYLLGTTKTIENGPNYLDYLLGDSVYGMVIEQPEDGSVSQVYTEVDGGSKDFKISGAGVLGVKDAGPSGYMYEGFWACPVDDVFTLWYGAEPALANMPSAECVSIMLETSNHLF